jgi:hypothetical protein
MNFIDRVLSMLVANWLWSLLGRLMSNRSRTEIRTGNQLTKRGQDMSSKPARHMQSADPDNSDITITILDE